MTIHPNGTMTFGRPINASDGGVYECAAKNEVGVGKAEVEINVTGRRKHCGLEQM